MGNHKLREDKKCQNCGFVVRKRFCPKCGQENVETRQSFHYLFTHFIEDLVHYDGSFWKTLKYLMFRPGRLTKEYLDGKRKTFVPPVKLYIFISFFVFFVGGMINSLTKTLNDENSSNSFTSSEIQQSQVRDSLNSYNLNDDFTRIRNQRAYDSIQLSLPEQERDTGLKRVFNRKMYSLGEINSDSKLWEKVGEMLNTHFQKFLFFFMPVFAFILWLFHSKKKYYYFDHGIFTLHYFSFILLSVFISSTILENFTDLGWILDIFIYIIKTIIYLWIIIYFFKAHRRLYGLSRLKTFFKGLFLMGVNLFFFILGILIYLFIILLMI